ncbi:MAG: hypothetical protein ACP5NC_07915 [Nitrososphaeria archaeon]
MKATGRPWVWLVALDLLLFYELLLNGYIAMHDFSTIPSFINPSYMIPQVLTGTSLTVNAFGVQLSPAFSVLTAIFLFIFRSYAYNALAFTVLLVYTLGTYYFFSQFSTKLMAFAGSAFALLFIGLLNVVIDSPFGLYIWFLPLTMGLYYKFRISGKLAYLLAAGVPVALSNVYGPAIPSLVFSLFAIELYFLVESRILPKFIKGLLSGAFLVLVIVVTHLSAFIYSQGIVSSLDRTVYASLTPGFSLVQDLISQAVYPWEQYQYQYLPHSIFSAYSILLVVLAVILIWNLVSGKRFLPLFFLIAFAGLLSYSYNYLGIYSAFNYLHMSILNHIDPFEYDPVIGLWFGMAIASFKLPGRKAVRAVVKIVLPVIIATLVLISGAFFVQSLTGIWSPVNVPQSYVRVYRELHNAQGVIITVPSTPSIETPFYQKTLHLFGTSVIYDAMPSSIYYFVPPGWMGEPESGSNPPYSTMYTYLYSGNSTGFKELAQRLDIEYIVYIPPSSMLGDFGSGYLNLAPLESITGFEPVTNYSDIVLLKNPYFQNNYSMTISWGKITVNFMKPLTRFVSPFPQGEQLQSYPATNITTINGLIAFTSISSISKIVITSKTVMYNEISELVAFTYIIIGCLALLFKKGLA